MATLSPVQATPFQGGYPAFEGNGRLAALRQAFSDTDSSTSGIAGKMTIYDPTIEIEEFLIPNDSKIYQDIRKLHQIYAGGN